MQTTSSRLRRYARSTGALLITVATFAVAATSARASCDGAIGAPATPQLYVADGDGAHGGIVRAGLDGTGVLEIVPGLVNPVGVAIDAGDRKLYFTDPGSQSILRSNLDGTSVETVFTYPFEEPNTPSGFAVDETSGLLYWVAYSNPLVQRATTGGAAVEAIISTDINLPGSIALDVASGKLYFGDAGYHRVQRANLDGTGVETILGGQTIGDAIALDPGGGKIYWTDAAIGRISRANLDGSDSELLVHDSAGPDGLALDLAAGKMYWANYYAASVRRANLDGTGVEDVVASGLRGAAGIALWHPPAPVCGNGCVEPGEECDPGAPVDGGCCSASCRLEAPGTVCRASAGACDPAEACDGSNAACPSDLRAPSGAECRAAAGACDVAESCDGVSAGCPADEVAPDGAACADGDACTGPDSCVAGACVAGPAIEQCGDGFVCGAESCDDGNLTNGDGCDATCTPTACGNGVLTPGEQCDDGNAAPGEACRADCSYDLIPGNGVGTARSDQRACLVELAVVNPGNAPATDRRGRPSSLQTCRNGDPDCDVEPDPAACGFRTVVCLNATDPRLPGCAPRGVADPVRVRSPIALRDPANASAVAGALRALRDPATGEIALGTPVAPSRTNLCSAPFTLRVPLARHGRPGRLDVRLDARAPAGPGAPIVDRDHVTLVCAP